MRKPRKDRTAIQNCGGGKKGKGSCGSWAGSSKGKTHIKIKA